MFYCLQREYSRYDSESFSKLRAAEHSSLSVYHNTYLRAALYDVTGEEKHKEMLYRVVSDLVKFKHPSGGYYEWDTVHRYPSAEITKSVMQRK